MGWEEMEGIDAVWHWGTSRARVLMNGETEIRNWLFMIFFLLAVDLRGLTRLVGRIVTSVGKRFQNQKPIDSQLQQLHWQTDERLLTTRIDAAEGDGSGRRNHRWGGLKHPSWNNQTSTSISQRSQNCQFQHYSFKWQDCSVLWTVPPLAADATCITTITAIPFLKNHKQKIETKTEGTEGWRMANKWSQTSGRRGHGDEGHGTVLIR